MKRFSFIIGLLSLNVFASTIELKIDAKLKKSKQVESIQVSRIEELGREWRLPLRGENDLVLVMSVNKDSNNKLMFKGQILEMINGKSITLSSPKVVSMVGKEVVIRVVDDRSEQSVDLKILPQKMNLD